MWQRSYLNLIMLIATIPETKFDLNKEDDNSEPKLVPTADVKDWFKN